MLSVYHDLQGKQCLRQFCDLSTCLVITSEETFHFKHHFQHQCKYEYVGATSCGISPPVKKCKLAFLWIKTVLNDNPGWPVHYSMFTGMVSAVYILLLWVCVHVCVRVHRTCQSSCYVCSAYSFAYSMSPSVMWLSILLMVLLWLTRSSFYQVCASPCSFFYLIFLRQSQVNLRIITALLRGTSHTQEHLVNSHVNTLYE